MSKRHLIILLLLSFGSVNQLLGQSEKSPISTKEELETSLKTVSCKNENRLEEVKKLFAEMGAKESDISVEEFDKGKIKNVTVKKVGRSPEKIVIGAHYDKTTFGCGAIDNWTGISIIAHLYKIIRQIDTEKTYLFVAFDQEEAGLLGSSAMVKKIPKEDLAQYCAMVNFDSFGFTAPYALENASNSKLIRIAQKVGEENSFKFVSSTITGADSDSTSFNRRDIPAISLSGIDNDWKKYLHTADDQLNRINISSVYLAYRFGLISIGKLDSTVCKDIR